MERTMTNTNLSNSFSTFEELVSLLAEAEDDKEKGRFCSADEFFEKLRWDMENGAI